VIALKDQNVLILGLGASGLAIARWCARCGAKVSVADTRSSPPQLEALRREVPQATFVCSDLDESLVEGKDFDAVFKSPGLSPAMVAGVVASFERDSRKVKGELELFSQALTDLKTLQAYAPAVLAVTGTNGKTTVTSLTGQLIAYAKKTVAVAGNIGPTLLDTLATRLDSGDLPEVWVVELSSFQLERVQGFEPTAATVLNVTQDHLDWHGSLPAYTAAKANVFGKHTKMLLNRNDPLVLAMLPVTSQQGRVKDRVVRDYETFGNDMPSRPGDFGLEEADGVVWLVRALQADGTHRKRSEAAEELFFQRLLPMDSLQIRGRHNAVNALAAVSLALSVGCSLAPLLFGLREYRGEPHRVESVALINGIEFFDDSKGTNVGATVAALTGLGADRKIVVILGGEGKGQDFSPLALPVSRFSKLVVLIGRDAELIRAALASTGVEMLAARTMHEAVALAFQGARPGDAVLMSPACASFDMFDNYPHRAAVFREAVAEIARTASLETVASA
jgi:UDP-N-acetylmuramoylalanine--D-glutamate ligase